MRALWYANAAPLPTAVMRFTSLGEVGKEKWSLVWPATARTSTTVRRPAAK